MHKIVLLRQGESTWNQENLFTDRAGWTDVGLAEKGLAEAVARFGGEQVLVWRRACDTPPPPAEDDPRLATGNPRYANLPSSRFPRTGCLKDTVERET